MKENRKNLEAVKERIKGYLALYLTSMGYNVARPFKCINPDHNDNHPSCGLVPQTDNRLFHCFSCGVVGDVFTAANFLEGKPVSGRGFIQENLAYLARRFGEEVPDMPDMSEEDLFEMEVESAYLHASMIVKSSPQSDTVKKRISELGWSRDVMARIGIGSVTSLDDYVQKMTGHYKHAPDLLKKVDLDNPRIFNENCLIYTIRDEHGAPVGFQARDLLYSQKKAKYDKKAQEIRDNALLSAQEKDHQLERLFCPTKFTNTSDKCPIYQKGKRLFNIDQARKYAPPLYVFEGNSDVATSCVGGLQNTVAICSTYFTRDHLDLVLSCGIKHLIFCLDADAAGDKGVNRFIQLLEECMLGHVGLRIEIIVMPTGTDDPDAYIRSFGDLRLGVQEFRKLPTMDIFSWTLRRRVKEGADPLSLAEEIIPLIVNEPNNLIRMTMARKLSQETGLDESGLWREVMRQVDIDRMGVEEEKTQIARKIAHDLQKNPSHAQTIIERARIQIETVEKRKSGYDPKSVIAAVRHQFERSEKIIHPVELPTGYSAFDKAFGGVPFADVFMSFPGKPNHSKALTLDSLLKTSTGWIPMREAKVGLPMASVDGEESVILTVAPQGVKKVYRVTFSDGRSVEACGEHLWKVKFVHQYSEGFADDKHNGWQVFTTDAIRNFCLNGNRKNSHRTVYVPLVSGDFGTPGALPVDPWLLGLLLGDGSLAGTPGFTSADPHIVDKAREKAAELGLRVSRQGKSKYGYRIADRKGKVNPLTRNLAALGLRGANCYTKFIPEIYLNADKASRWELLQGLMDTDGCASRSLNTSYSSSSESLARGVQLLVRSLGGLCSVTPRATSYSYKGEKKQGAISYGLNIRMPLREKMYSLPRKQEIATPRQNQPRLSIVDIQYIGEKETQCIGVSHPSHLFITNDYIVTHNTTFLFNMAWRLVENNPNCRVLVHTMDDALSSAQPRLMATKFRRPTDWFKRVGYYRNQIEGFDRLYNQSRQWLDNLVETERLILADMSVLAPALASLEVWVRSLRNKFPDDHLVVIGDNFVQYDLPGFEGERLDREKSRIIKRIANEYHATMMLTVELPKGALRPGLRPRMSNIKGTSGVAYDVSANVGVYNDLKDLREKAHLTWDGPPERIIGPNGEEVFSPKKMPVIELVIDKSKISSFDGSIYYRLDPESGAMDECSEQEQGKYRELALRASSPGTEESFSYNQHRSPF